MADSHPTLGFVIHDVARLLRKRFEQRVRAAGLGLTRSQWQVLSFLARHEGIHQGGLADILDIEPITLGRILDKLEARDLVERRPHASDRRVWLLHLRPAARPLLDRMRVLGEATRAEGLAGIPEHDRAQLLSVLTAMRSNLADACQSPVDEEEASHG